MVTPGTSDSNALYSLLSAISNPESAKAALDKISAASAELDAKTIDFQNLQAQKNVLIEEQTKLQTDISSLQATVDANEVYISSAKADLAAQTDALNRNISLFNLSKSKSDSDAAIRTKSLDDRESAVSAREAVVENNIARTADELSNAQILKEDLLKKQAALKAIIS